MLKIYPAKERDYTRQRRLSHSYFVIRNYKIKSACGVDNARSLKEAGKIFCGKTLPCLEDQREDCNACREEATAVAQT